MQGLGHLHIVAISGVYSQIPRRQAQKKEKPKRRREKEGERDHTARLFEIVTVTDQQELTVRNKIFPFISSTIKRCPNWDEA